MSTLDDLMRRSGGACELCTAPDALAPFAVEPRDVDSAQTAALLCAVCTAQLSARPDDADHFKALSDTMWTEHAPVQVLIWRTLDALSDQAWAQELLDMLYLEDEVLALAKSGQFKALGALTRDSNGAVLNAGDTVTLIKDLPVKGAGFTAKRGTSVRGISLSDNPDHVEGRVNGQRIVLVAAYLKKS